MAKERASWAGLGPSLTSASKCSEAVNRSSLATPKPKPGSCQAQTRVPRPSS
jgi:hypothetical protein